MDTDLMLVSGIVLAVLSIPAMLSAFSEGRAPRLGTFVVLTAGVLIFVALTESATAYSFPELPQVFGRVFGRLAN